MGPKRRLINAGAVLKPDSEDPEPFFWIDPDTGKLEAHPSLDLGGPRISTTQSNVSRAKRHTSIPSVKSRFPIGRDLCPYWWWVANAPKPIAIAKSFGEPPQRALDPGSKAVENRGPDSKDRRCHRQRHHQKLDGLLWHPFLEYRLDQLAALSQQCIANRCHRAGSTARSRNWTHRSSLTP
jgi:hypothetical protein